MGAGYSGDVDHYGGTATPFGVTATTRSVTVSVSCSPSTISALGTTTCKVTVTDSDTGTPINPTGTVHFDDNGAGGGFSTADCTLSSGTCSVNYTGPIVVVPGTLVTITATYSGDTDHSGGSDMTTVTIN